MIWWVLLGGLFGLSIGFAIGMFVMRPNEDGLLRAYIPDIEDEQPYLYAEWYYPIWVIVNKKRVTLKVDTQNLKTRK